ncbi:MAG TPA: hypothetical protein VF546_00445 [Pyrinomonadaceae bacterium]|jgi:hypothetical protein
MLDRETGELILAGPIRLGPRLRRRHVRALPLPRPAVSLIKNGPWHSFRVEGANERGEKLFVTLQFHGGTLKWIDFVVDELDRTRVPQADWEDAQKLLHDRWLEACLGTPPPYAYPWGRVESSYDPRSDCSSIIVAYERRRTGLLGWLLGS